MNEIIMIRCTPELKRKLKREAREKKLSMSEWMRLKLEKFDADRVRVRRTKERLIIEIKT